MNFLWGLVHNLDGMELGNNVKVTFIQEIFYKLRVNHLWGVKLKALEGVFMTLPSEAHVLIIEIHCHET